MTYYRHIGIVSGVGVGGGSLVYANTLPVPKKSFFECVVFSKIFEKIMVFQHDSPSLGAEAYVRQKHDFSKIFENSPFPSA